MFSKLHNHAKLPSYAHSNDACADIYSSLKTIIKGNSIERIHTGISVKIPIGYEIQIRPKSGLANSGLIAVFGTIDEGYEGEIQVLMQNIRNGPIHIYAGDKIAQISLQPVIRFPDLEVITKLERSDHGFGSSGR
jgi:dUTP pyrophosphatase